MTKPLAKDRTSSEAPAARMFPRVVVGSAGLAAFALVWFGIAGRATWTQGWALLLAFVGYVGTLTWRLARSDPDLLRERTARRQTSNLGTRP